MPKAYLVYNLNDADDKNDYNIVHNAINLYLTLIDVRDHLRTQLKYAAHEKKFSKQTIEELEIVRAMLYDRIDFDELG